MIIWLASYPRSGNTLLRTIINQTMHVKSYSDEFEESVNNVLSPKSLEITGKILAKGDWQTFYQDASASKDVFLVKTHTLPRDNNPAIYVVRDGRKALLSYSRFHERYTNFPYPSLFELILGLDYYGDWSQHVQAWAHRENTLFLKYEDLLHPSKDLLVRLATKIGYTGQIQSWENPFKELQRADPAFFREGDAAWSNDESWLPILNSIFFHLHGEIMSQLGYAGESANAFTQHSITNEMADLIRITRHLRDENRQYRTICSDRLEVITELKRACDERLALIETLNQRLTWGR